MTSDDVTDESDLDSDEGPVPPPVQKKVTAKKQKQLNNSDKIPQKFAGITKPVTKKSSPREILSSKGNDEDEDGSKVDEEKKSTKLMLPGLTRSQRASKYKEIAKSNFDKKKAPKEDVSDWASRGRGGGFRGGRAGGLGGRGAGRSGDFGNRGAKRGGRGESRGGFGDRG
ncbi:hypothetical protein HK096_007216, partial [Nowakowskiella sp. JEL0078]